MEDLTADRVALVCVRDSRRFGLQVLLQEEHAEDSAETGRVAFPEGGAERQDHAAAVLERCHGRTGDEARRWLGYDMSPARALGFWTAGLRVLLVATGVFLAVEGAQRAPARRMIPSRERHGLKGMLDLAAFAACRDLRCDLSPLLFFSRWTGFDTVAVKGYFLVHLPERVRVAGFAWQAPETALLGWSRGRLSLDFQTFACLRVLTDFSSCDSLLSEYAVR